VVCNVAPVAAAVADDARGPDTRDAHPRELTMRHLQTGLAALAALAFTAGVLAHGAALDGYAQALHPVALLGASGVPGAAGFNVLAFVLPGLLMAWLAMRLRGSLSSHAPWPARIGARLCLLAALAFAAQGLVPLDPEDLDAAASRLHATAWSFWWIAFVPGGLLLAAAGATDPPAQPAWRWACAVCALLVLGLAAVPWPGVPGGLLQRCAYAAWFAWGLACGLQLDRLRPLSRGAA
jgi:hypothetical protein